MVVAELVLDFATIPFQTGTVVYLQTEDGPEIFRLVFLNGMVDDLTYDPAGWNDARVVIRNYTQDYLLTVNGVQAPPHPLSEYCTNIGGCHSVQALDASSFLSSVQGEGWIDEISLVKVSGSSSRTLFEATFDDA